MVINALSCTYLAHRHVTETDEIRELVILYILCIFFISSQAPVVVRVNPYWIWSAMKRYRLHMVVSHSNVLISSLFKTNTWFVIYNTMFDAKKPLNEHGVWNALRNGENVKKTANSRFRKQTIIKLERAPSSDSEVFNLILSRTLLEHRYVVRLHNTRSAALT